MDVIDYLHGKQAALGETDYVFCKRIGVGYTTWHRWSRRKRRRQDGPAAAAVRAFPEDRQLISDLFFGATPAAVDAA